MLTSDIYTHRFAVLLWHLCCEDSLQQLVVPFQRELDRALLKGLVRLRFRRFVRQRKLRVTIQFPQELRRAHSNSVTRCRDVARIDELLDQRRSDCVSPSDGWASRLDGRRGRSGLRSRGRPEVLPVLLELLCGCQRLRRSI
jgi:hypothetical protein